MSLPELSSGTLPKTTILNIISSDESSSQPVERGLERLSAFPESRTPYIAETRRLILGRFPYSIVYSPEGGSIIIIAISHHRRLPGYWKERR